MTKPKGREALETRGQAQTILARVRPAFRDHVRPHTENGEGERLGGGSILNARWNHRLSRDLDVYVRLRTTEDGRRILDRAAEACGGYRIEHPTFRRIEFERNRENHVDVSFGEPTPLEGEETAIVDGEPARVLSNAQIMSGKLLGRGMTAPGRDLVDIAACGVADPEALEIAVNGLDDEKANAILQVYDEMAEEYAKETADLEGVATSLEPVLEDPTGYAGRAIRTARYERVEMRTRAGAAEIETTTQAGTRTRRYEDAERLRQGMERDGFNAFLTAQVRDQHAVLDAMVDALWSGQDMTVLIVKPERLRRAHAEVEVPELEWRPEGSEGIGNADDDRRQKLVDKGNTLPAPKPAAPGVQGTGAETREVSETESVDLGNTSKQKHPQARSQQARPKILSAGGHAPVPQPPPSPATGAGAAAQRETRKKHGHGRNAGQR